MIENSSLASIIIFYLLAITVIASAIGVVTSKNVMLACLSLLAVLLGIAGLFIFLAAEFMALVQILIYGGTVVTVIVFAIILTNLKDFSNLKPGTILSDGDKIRTGDRGFAAIIFIDDKSTLKLKNLNFVNGSGMNLKILQT